MSADTRQGPGTGSDALSSRPKVVYEEVYCKRGDVENRIQKLHHGLEIDRTSRTRFWANQLRGLMTATAFVLMQELRHHASGTSRNLGYLHARA